MRTLTTRLILGLVIAIFGTSIASAASNKTLVLNLKGKAAMYEAMVPDIDGDGLEDPAMCFDAKLFDMRTGRRVGKATDCLSNVTMVGDGLQLVGTAYFRIKGKGTLITRGNTTVQPVNWPTRQFTHITGGNGPENAVIRGTRHFRKAKGVQRLSGMVDMSNFGAAPGDIIDFDCIFVIKLK